ncbi:hypothetical protein OROHE_021319 [Orobanche hederae]
MISQLFTEFKLEAVHRTQLTRQIEDHSSVSNPVERMGNQSNTLRPCLFRCNSAIVEAVVNAGPDVFISSSGQV